MHGGNELPPTAGLPLRFRDFIRSPAMPFARGLESLFGFSDPVLTCSGTAAMVVALHTLRRRQPGRTDVIVPAYTCPLVPLAVKLTPGLRAVPCDTLRGGIDFDPEKLSSLCGPRTLAVVPTHLGGRVADVAAAKDIAAPHGVAVLEDAAQALGALDREKSVGLAGDVSFFSLAAGKGLTTYEGGILCGNDPALRGELAATARRLLGSAPYWTVRRNLELFGYAALYTPARLGLVYGRKLRAMLDKGDEEAAVGDRFTLADIPLHGLDGFRRRVAANALERLPEFLKAAAARAGRRLPAFEKLDGVRVIGDRPGTLGVWPFFMVLLPGREQRDKALNRLWRAGLGVTKLFTRALPGYSFLASSLEAGRGGCPNAGDLADRMLTVTNTHWLDDGDFSHILDEIGEGPC